ncbi:MAG: head-tail connector protein [Eubacteriales bacterium]
MAYVDKTYYDNDYIGIGTETADFPRYEARAREIIDQITRNRIVENGLASYSASVQTAIKKAVCAQIDYYVLNGIDAASSGLSAESFTVGKVSVSGAKVSGKISMVSPQAIAFLEPTGLMSNVAYIRR